MPHIQRLIILEAKAVSAGVERVEGIVPEGYALGQNYPNPFNPETAINFAIPASAHVTITIHNALGQEVATLVDTELEPGAYSTSFNARDFGSGTYFYTLRAGSFTDTKKMLLLK